MNVAFKKNEIKYKTKTLNLTNVSSKRSNYENEQLNDIYLLILQRKLRNIVIININFDVDDERFELEKIQTLYNKTRFFESLNRF